VQPIHDIVKMLKRFREKNKTSFPYIHCDACQAPLFIELNILKLGVDLLTLDGIKIYGPRGMGILYVRHNVELHPIFFGGGQEWGLRSGTENVGGIVGMSKALELAQKHREKESLRLSEIRDYTIEKILATFSNSELNGSRKDRLPNNINICFPRLDAEFAVISLDIAGISASYSSSCRTLKEDSSSYVVSALGKQNCGESSLRFTLGRDTTNGGIDQLVSSLERIVK
jgi:cysteine desulfurase